MPARNEMTSKERILRTIEWKDVDHLPLTLNGICHTCMVDINKKLNWDQFKIADYFRELGTDTGISVYVPVTLSPHVEEKYSIRQVPGEKDDILFKEYITPKGRLAQAVRKNAHYPYNYISLFSDHLVPPGRSYKYMIDSPNELDMLEDILGDPDEAAFSESREYARAAKKYANERGIVLTAYNEGIGDPLLWLSGLNNIVFMGADEPEALGRYVDILSRWNMRYIEIMLDMGVDIILRRGWYECSDFWSPERYRRFLLPALKKEVEFTHNAGAKYGYIMNSGVDALADLIVESGVDMQTNAEPLKNNFIGLRKTFQNKVAMCSGINNYKVIEAGGETDIENAFFYAVENYAPGGGFILAPSDSIGGIGLSNDKISEKNIKNAHFLVETWKKYI